MTAVPAVASSTPVPSGATPAAPGRSTAPAQGAAAPPSKAPSQAGSPAAGAGGRSAGASPAGNHPAGRAPETVTFGVSHYPDVDRQPVYVGFEPFKEPGFAENTDGYDFQFGEYGYVNTHGGGAITKAEADGSCNPDRLSKTQMHVNAGETVVWCGRSGAGLIVTMKVGFDGASYTVLFTF